MRFDIDAALRDASNPESQAQPWYKKAWNEIKATSGMWAGKPDWIPDKVQNNNPDWIPDKVQVHGPWEDYQTTASDGPWNDYKKTKIKTPGSQSGGLDIDAALKQAGSPEMPWYKNPPGFFSRVGSDIGKRYGNVGDIAMTSPQKGPLVTALHLGGETAGLVNDIFGEVMKSTYNTMMPDNAKDWIKGKLTSISQTSAGQTGLKALKTGSDAWTTFSKDYPDVAQSITSALNIAGAYPSSKALGEGFNIVRDAASLTGKAITPITEKTSSRIINSLIKPKNREFAYGKNPGLGVANEGIVATSLEDLANKVTKTKHAIGQELETVLSSPENMNKVSDFSSVINPLDGAIRRASTNPRTNKAIIERLVNAKLDILKAVEQEDGRLVYGRNLSAMNPLDAVKMKREIGDITKFTGSLSDDASVNNALKRVYGSIDSKVDEMVPATKTLNERYANLTGADVSIKNREINLSRQNLTHLPGLGTGIAAAVMTGQPLTGVAALVLYETLSSTLSKTTVAQIFKKMGISEFIPKSRTGQAIQGLFKGKPPIPTTPPVVPVPKQIGYTTGL